MGFAVLVVVSLCRDLADDGVLLRDEATDREIDEAMQRGAAPTAVVLVGLLVGLLLLPVDDRGPTATPPAEASSPRGANSITPTPTTAPEPPQHFTATIVSSGVVRGQVVLDAAGTAVTVQLAQIAPPSCPKSLTSDQVDRAWRMALASQIPRGTQVAVTRLRPGSSYVHLIVRGRATATSSASPAPARAATTPAPTSSPAASQSPAAASATRTASVSEVLVRAGLAVPAGAPDITGYKSVEHAAADYTRDATGSNVSGPYFTALRSAWIAAVRGRAGTHGTCLRAKADANRATAAAQRAAAEAAEAERRREAERGRQQESTYSNDGDGSYGDGRCRSCRRLLRWIF